LGIKLYLHGIPTTMLVEKLNSAPVAVLDLAVEMNDGAYSLWHGFMLHIYSEDYNHISTTRKVITTNKEGNSRILVVIYITCRHGSQPRIDMP
jgi:hypothetical protein